MDIWEVRRDDGHVVTNDPTRLDFDFIHPALASSYWSPGITREKVERAARHSVAIGLYDSNRFQIGYCRVITDHTSFGYLADVWIDPSRRAGGLGTFFVETVVNRPEWADLRRFMLFTADGQGLYAKFGFGPLDKPERVMARPAPA
ncbi:GNAT family N-acetyltransferase [Niveispirillum sp. KHB5.9]|uniref:GNAT family N-acetyltransferase n=1 Tax=Niveispirillum sp. KHB5.9 TaxID=3400269 RepID=UPI003A8945DE